MIPADWRMFMSKGEALVFNSHNILGTYTIPDINGDPIVVKYRAGPLTGFVIENFDEVQARTDPASASVSQDLSQISGIASSVVPEPIIT